MKVSILKDGFFLFWSVVNVRSMIKLIARLTVRNSFFETKFFIKILIIKMYINPCNGQKKEYNEDRINRRWIMLEIRNLEKSFDPKQVLFGVNFQAQPGRILGLVGKNGAGKTTIFHSILKFLDYQGEIWLDGQEIDQETYAQIGYLPEERSLMPKLTVLEQVRYLAMLKGMNAKEVKEKLPQWMEKLEVKGKLTDKIKSLSKGNQQKIQLIITLMHEPDLIILDEPFSGLDPVNTELLKQVILKEKERGATIIFSDHVMTNVEELCDDILMIRDGRVVLHGPVQDVRNQYGKTRLFVASEKSQEELEKLPHVIHASLTKQGIWKLILDDENAGQELFAILTQGHYIATFDQQAPTIDEIFKLESGVEV